MPKGRTRAKAFLRSAGDFFWPPRSLLDLKRAGRRDGLETLCGWMRQAGGAEIGRRVIVDALVRTRRTPSHAGLAGRARRRNASGAFRVRKGRIAAITGQRALLVDDVLTTGATLSACTRALKQAGARHVDVLVLARVVRETDVTI